MWAVEVEDYTLTKRATERRDIASWHQECQLASHDPFTHFTPFLDISLRTLIYQFLTRYDQNEWKLDATDSCTVS